MKKDVSEINALASAIRGSKATVAEPELPRRVLRLLAASRHGLSPEELEELTSPRFARDNLDTLLRDAAPHLHVRVGFVDFSGLELRAAVREECFTDATAEKASHRELAEYFRRRADPDGALTWRGSPRGVSEMPYHMVHAGMFDEVESALTDLKFVQAKCEHGMVSDLQEDYRMTLGARPGGGSEWDPFCRQVVMRRVPGWLSENTAAVVEGVADMVPDSGSAPVLLKLRALRANERNVGIQEAVYGQGKGTPPEDLFGTGNAFPDGPPSLDSASTAPAPDPTKNGGRSVDRLREFATFVAYHGHHLAEMPQETVTTARNHASRGPVAEQAEQLAERLERTWIALVRRPEALPRQPLIVRNLGVDPQEASVVAVDSSGTMAASAGRHGVLRLWDATTGRLLRTFSGSTHSIEAIALTPDGATAVAGDAQGMLRVWDAASGACRRTIEAPIKGINHLAVTADGRLAISAGGTKEVHVWDLCSGTLIRTLAGHTEKISSLGITPDGMLAISGAGDGTVRIWDVERGETLRTISIEHSHEHLAAISASGRIAASAFAEYVVVWDVVSGQTMEVGTCSEYPHIDSQSLAIQGLHYRWMSMAFASDGRTLVVASERDYMGATRIGTVSVVDVTAATMSRRLLEPSAKVSSMALSANGGICIMGRSGDLPAVLNLASGQNRQSLLAHLGAVTDIVLPKLGKKKAVTVGSDYIMGVWDLDTGEQDRHVDLRPGGMFSLASFVPLVRQARLTPDGTTAVCLSVTSDPMVMEFGERTILRRLRGPERSYTNVRSLVLSPDGRLAVEAAFGRKTACVYDIETGLLLQSHACSESPLVCIAVSPDGTFVLSNGTDRSIEAWDIRTSGGMASLPAEHDLIFPIFISHDGRTAASVDESGTVYVWSVRTGRILRKVTTGCGIDLCRAIMLGVPFAVTSDCRYAILGERGTLRVWDTITGKCVAGYAVDSPVTAVSAVTHAGRFVCGTEGGQAHFLALRNIAVEAPRHTATRLFRRRTGEKHGYWDDSVTIICEWCGEMFPADAAILDAIAAIARDAGLSPDQSPCMGLPDEAWEEKRLLSLCPHCRNPIRINPFVVDNRGR